jgi:hypothetical protein
VVLATVTRTWRSSGERAKTAMRLTLGSIQPTDRSRKCRTVRRRDGRDLVSGGAVGSARELGDGYGGNGVSDFRLGEPGQSEREGEENERE